MTSASPPPWSPDPSGGADRYRRTSQIVIGVEPDSGRPAVALDGVPIDSSGGWQAAVDDGFAQVADTAARIGETVSVVVVDTASDWTGRFVVEPDRSIAEDLAPPPPPRRRRGPLLALLAAAGVLVAGAAVVVGTQLTSSEQPLAAAPPTPTSAAGRPTRTPGPSPSVAAPRPALPPVTLAPISPPVTAPPDTATPDTARPGPAAPESVVPAPRGPEARPGTEPARSAPTTRAETPAETGTGTETGAPARAPPAPAPAPAAPQGVSGRVIDGQGACLVASSSSLGSGSCLPDRSDQLWTRTAEGQLSAAGGCLTEVAAQTLAVQPCRPGDAKQTWRTGSRLIVNAGTGACALVRRPESGRPVAVTAPCSTTERTAQFVG